MIQVAATVERNIFQTQLTGFPGDGLAYQLAFFNFIDLLGSDVLVLRRGGSKRLAFAVVDQLNIDIGVAPEYRQPWLLCGPDDLLTDAEPDLLPSF